MSTTKNPKILFFSGVPIDDSAEIYRSGFLARLLAEKGYQVIFASVEANFQGVAKRKVNGVEIIFLGQAHYRAEKNFSSRSKLSWGQVIWENGRTCWQLVQLLRKEQPNRVVMVTAMPVSLTAGLVSRLFGFRCLIDIDDLAIGQMAVAGYSQFLVQVYDWLERRAVGFFFDRVSVCSGFLQIRYLGSTLIPNMIDTDWWQQPACRRGRPAHRPREKMVFVGQIGPYHGQKETLKELAPVFKKRKNLQLIFVGGGEQSESLNLEIKKLSLGKQVFLTGQVTQEKVRKFMNESMIGLLPLWASPVHQARHPLKLLEYLAVGLVVITNQTKETAKIINDKENGFLCPPGDLSCFSQRVKVILDNPDLARKISQKAKLSAQKFNHKTIFPQWADFLEI
jgi:glycosyltransferase involved in cell wall biosynthesis